MTRARPWVALIAAAIVFALVVGLPLSYALPLIGLSLAAASPPDYVADRDCCANLSGANLLPHLPSLSQLAPILAVAAWSGRQLITASTVSSSVQGALVLLLAAKFAWVRGWIWLWRVTRCRAGRAY